MDARTLLMDVLKVLDRNAWEACCISDWDMTDLVSEVDRLMSSVQFTYVSAPDHIKVDRA